MAPEGSSASTASSLTFSALPPSLVMDQSKAFPGGHWAAEPESTPSVECEQATRAVWLAPTPVPFFTSQRYSRRDKLNYDKVAVIENVPPVNGLAFRPEALGTLGWKAYEHPEGSVYFRTENFYTNLWLYDTVKLEAIEKVVEKIRAKLPSFPALSGKDIEFGLDLVDDKEPGAAAGDKLGCYYAVDKTSQEAFWLHEVPASFYCDGAELEIISREYLRKTGTARGWGTGGYTHMPEYAVLPNVFSRYHCYMFPHGQSVSSDTVGQLRARLSYNVFDKMTSTTSTSPYNEDDGLRLSQMFREMEASDPSGHYARPEHVVMIARLQTTFLREKLLRFHGERYAQLDSDRSVFEEDPQDSRHSRLFQAISLLFFRGPHVYYEQLSRIWVDNKINYDPWSGFVGGLQRDWAAYTIPAAIILTVNVVFLAFQSIDQGAGILKDGTTGQIASYISTLLNIGCVSASMILAEQHRMSSHHSTETAVTYLCERALSKKGVERLAVLFSVPAAFFRWGLVSFAIAILSLCLHEAGSGATRIAACVVAGISILLLIMILFNGESKSRFTLSTSPLARGVRQLCRLAKRGTVLVATVPKLFSKPKTSVLPQ